MGVLPSVGELIRIFDPTGLLQNTRAKRAADCSSNLVPTETRIATNMIEHKCVSENYRQCLVESSGRKSDLRSLYSSKNLHDFIGFFHASKRLHELDTIVFLGRDLDSGSAYIRPWRTLAIYQPPGLQKSFKGHHYWTIIDEGKSALLRSNTRCSHPSGVVAESGRHHEA
jgi:hypothetical protein